MNEVKPSEETLFEAVSQLPPEKRGAYLAQTCAEDAALRERWKSCSGRMTEPVILWPSRPLRRFPGRQGCTSP